VNDFESIKNLYKLDAMTGRAQLDLLRENRGYYGKTQLILKFRF